MLVETKSELQGAPVPSKAPQGPVSVWKTPPSNSDLIEAVSQLQRICHNALLKCAADLNWYNSSVVFMSEDDALRAQTHLLGVPACSYEGLRTHNLNIDANSIRQEALKSFGGVSPSPATPLARSEHLLVANTLLERLKAAAMGDMPSHDEIANAEALFMRAKAGLSQS